MDPAPGCTRSCRMAGDRECGVLPLRLLRARLCTGCGVRADGWGAVAGLALSVLLAGMQDSDGHPSGAEFDVGAGLKKIVHWATTYDFAALVS